MRGSIRVMFLRPLLIGLVVQLLACAGSPYPLSDHFDGSHFHNPEGRPAKGLAGVIRWQMTNFDRPDWLSYRELPPGPKPPIRIGGAQLRVTFINHATTLLQFDGLNVLTDPIWSERASPLSWIGPKRVRPPGIAFEDLPPIDLVVVSHDHYDHLDLPTLTRLARAHPAAAFVVPLGLGKILRDAGIANVRELDWWQSVASGHGVSTWIVPAQHFSARGPFDRDETLWAGFVFETQAGPVFFAGDTGMSDHFRQVRARFGPMRLAVLPIGAFEPRWFMEPIHIDPAQALQAHRALAAQASVGMHFGTFHLADESQTGAEEELSSALLGAPDPKPAFWVLGFGEGRMIAPLQTFPR